MYTKSGSQVRLTTIIVRVLPQSDAFPEESQEALRLGNISDYHAGGVNDYHRAIVDHLPECRSCLARYYCGGGCFYHNMANTGDMHRPDALDCQERKATYEGLIQVYCRLDEGEKEYLKEILKDVTSERHP